MSNNITSNNSDKEFGEIYEPFEFKFIITNLNSEHQDLTMIVNLNNNEIDTKSINANEEILFKLNSETFNSLAKDSNNSITLIISNSVDTLTIALNFTKIEEPNNIPTVPTGLQIQSDSSKIVTGSKITITWEASTDLDGDNISYDIYFYNGTTNLMVNSGCKNLSYVYTIPSTDETRHAKLRVRAFDGKGYSEFIESNEFEINIQEEQSCNVNVYIDRKNYGEIEDPIDIKYFIGSNNSNNDDVFVKILVDGKMMDYIVSPFK